MKNFRNLKKMQKKQKKYLKENSWRETMYDYNDEVDKLNSAFWRECGECGSNCESWPGWG